MFSIASSSRTSPKRGGSVSGAGGSGASDEGINSPGHDEGEWEGLSADEAEEPVKKKARKSTKGKSKLPKSMVGKLSKLVTLPVDVLSEIGGHLDPLTLLYLSRASKGFNQIFGSRSSRSVWREARSNVGLADLEADDLPEPAFAALMFEKVCCVCGKDRAGVVDYHLRKRFCKPCQKANVAAFYMITYHHKDVTWHPYSFLCTLPTLKSGKSNKSQSVFYFTPELIMINDELHAIQARIEEADEKHVPTSAKSNGVKPFCRRPTFPQGQAEFSEAEAELKEYVVKKTALIASIAADAEELEKYVKEGKSGNRQAQQEAKTKRLQAIYERLEALDYQKTDLRLWNPAIMKLVDQPRALTETIWKRISPEILKAAEENRNNRLENERRSLRHDAKYTLRPYFTASQAAFVADGGEGDFPSFATFTKLDVVKPFWDSDDRVPLNDASWAAVSSQAVKDGLQLTRNFKIKLAQHLVRALDGTVHAIDPSLAVKIVPPSDAAADSSWTSTVTAEELTALFLPYKHRLVCGICVAYHSRGVLHTCNSALQHAESWEHDLSAVQDSQEWYLKGWADVVDEAAKLAGVESGPTLSTPEALESVGDRWVCEGCPTFEDDLKRTNHFALLYGYNKVRAGYAWSEMVSHLISGHLRSSAKAASPVLAIAEEVKEEVKSVKMEETKEGVKEEEE